MSFTINNSLSANSMNFNNNTNEAKDAASKALERIAAGHAVENTADAVISHQLRVDEAVSAQEVANANQSVAMLQIQDSGLGSLQDDTLRIRELNVQMNSAALGEDQRASIQSEINGLRESMGQTLENTQYNGQQLLSDVKLSAMDDGDLDSIDAFMDSLSSRRADVGASMNKAESAIDTLNVKIVNTAAARSQLSDADMAEQINNFNTENLKTQASLFAQSHNTQYLARQVGALLG